MVVVEGLSIQTTSIDSGNTTCCGRYVLGLIGLAGALRRGNAWRQCLGGWA